jgi:Mg-chelatase subunit ChlD
VNSKRFAAGVLGAEAMILAALAGLGYAYVRSVNDRLPQEVRQSPTPRPRRPAPGQREDLKAFADDYKKDGKTIADLAASMNSRKDVDLLMFVIDTSGSMNDDRRELRNSIDKTLARYRGKLVQIINFGDTAQVTGEPTRDIAELQRRLDATQDLGGTENSLQALTFAAQQARPKFKKPLIVLMTDAAPHDGLANSTSSATTAQTADAINAANAELKVWAAFDNAEYWEGGAAATCDAYPDLVKSIKAGGEMLLVERKKLDPFSLFR